MAWLYNQDTDEPMQVKRVLLTLAAASVALGAWLAWKPTSFPTHAAQTNAAAHRPAPPITAGAHQSTDLTTASPQRAWFLALKQRADAGDAVSQRLLAQAYARCMGVNYNRELYAERNRLRIAEATDAEARSVMETQLSNRMQECDAVEAGAEVTWEQMRSAYARAARSGDLAARIMDIIHNDREYLDADQAAELLETVVTSKDPAAVYAYGSMLGGIISMNMEAPYAPLVEGTRADLAWMVVACRMGYECGPDSEPMSDLCQMQDYCYRGSFEHAVRRTLETDSEREALDRHIEAILRVVNP
ncbi:hypothetical protein [Stenotrophomonas sp.]|uniref:hypothetical protein n=1 Tax=Stenotrophomonas sp. TaxID=69392 RepID=UPI0028972542|nr:hypothetical protein [Stenotrophomonas sp.]